MPRIRPDRPARRLVALVISVAAMLPGSALAQPAHVAQPLKPRELTLSPAAAPVPALKYRLLPSWADLKPGDAAPIYLRIRNFEESQQPGEGLEPLWNQISTNSKQWMNVPLDQFPVADARKFVNLWSRQLDQIGFGAHRKTCDWNYTLPEQRLNRIDVVLSDATAMRQWARLLAIKARLEIAERKYDEAINTIETGLAFARHIAEGPFLINGLVGMSVANVMLAAVNELVARPGAPNLYWALTALPNPLFDIRHELETERTLCENLIPELAQAVSSEPRTAAEWTSLLARMEQGFVKWNRYFHLKALAPGDLAQHKAVLVPTARDYLKAKRDVTDQQLAAMSDDQVVALYIAGRYHELWDDFFKAGYLPLKDAIPQIAAAQKRLADAGSGPLGLLTMILPSIESVMTSRLQIDRHIAALRVIEALRLHAAAHGGQLAESLDQITEVPVPNDPATNEPFIYRAADDAAILHGVRAELPPPWISYRITIRR